MPDIFYKTVVSITQPPRLVEISMVTTKTETAIVNPDGTCVHQEPQVKVENLEKWSVKAMMDVDWGGIREEEFFFRTETDCAKIKPGYKEAI